MIEHPIRPTDPSALPNVSIQTEARPRYEAPMVISYRDEDILEELGPAQAFTSAADNTGFGTP